MIKLQRVLCPTDFSEYSHKSVQYGCELAKVFNVELHVMQDYNALAPATGESFAVFADWLPQFTKLAQEKLAKPSGSNWEPPLKVVRNTSAGGAIDEIVKYAREREIDLILKTTHGRTGLKHFLMSSDAESVERYASCPVLTVRHPEHEFTES